MRIRTSLSVCVIVLLSLAACGGGGDSGGSGGGGGGSLTVSITTISLPGAILNDQYGGYVATANGSGSGYTWSVTSGTLPTGLTLMQGSPDAIISGTAGAAGTFNFTLRVQDPAGGSDSRAFSITVTAQVFIVTTSLGQGPISQTYSESVLTAGGSGTGYTWSITAGALPTGLSLVQGSPNATISGTPTVAGIANFTLQVDDPAGGSYSRGFSISIYASPPTPLNLTTVSVPDGNLGVAYSQTVAASGGATPYAWAVISGALPPGITLTPGTPSATLGGNPTTAGTYNFTLRVDDSGAQYASRSYTINVLSGSLSITTTSLPNGQQGTTYTQSVTATGGTQSGYSWTVQSGSLPTGLSLVSGTPAASIQGTPTAVGAFNFTLRVQDSASNSTTQAFSVNITAAPLSITTTTLPAGTEGAAYSQSVTATGGTGAGYTWSVIVGALPPGLSIGSGTPSGTISGTPTYSSTYNFTIQVEDSGANTSTQALSLTINMGTLAITTPSVLPYAVDANDYHYAVRAIGGTHNYSWQMLTGTLPTGLTFEVLGTGAVVTGTPTQTGTFGFTVEVDDGTNTAQKALSLTVHDNTSLRIVTVNIGHWLVGETINDPLVAVGGAGGYSWAVAAGSSLPPGAGIQNGASPQMNGAATQSGTYTFTLQVTDSAPTTINRTYTVDVVVATPDFSGKPVTDNSVFMISTTGSMGGSAIAIIRAELWTAIGSSHSGWHLDVVSFASQFPSTQNYNFKCFGQLTRMDAMRRWQLMKWVYGPALNPGSTNTMYPALQDVMATYPTTLQSLFLTTRSDPSVGGSGSAVLADSPSWFAPFTSLTLHCFSIAGGGATFMQQLAAVHSGTYTPI
ncbi:MAG: putative Ig domain-containing protein [Planctomycetes bacterium]|nr:putative Ig domain-containing protein [Planctomycetota bacterium]